MLAAVHPSYHRVDMFGFQYPQIGNVLHNMCMLLCPGTGTLHSYWHSQHALDHHSLFLKNDIMYIEK